MLGQKSLHNRRDVESGITEIPMITSIDSAGRELEITFTEINSDVSLFEQFSHTGFVMLESDFHVVEHELALRRFYLPVDHSQASFLRECADARQS